MYITDLRDDDIEISCKVVIVGNGAVGKSSMIQRYCRGTFTKSYKKTIGVDFLEKQLRIHGEDVRLMLWDTAGQEEFDAITKAYYRGAQACVVAFSTTDRDSLLAVKKWKKKVEDECGDIPMVLVQNKIDLISQSEIDQLEAERLAAEAGMRLYRTSVKDDLNVGSVFQHLAENYVNKVKSYDMGLSPAYQSLQIGETNMKHHTTSYSHNQGLYNNHHNNYYNNHYSSAHMNNITNNRMKNGAIYNNNNGSDHVDYSGRITLTGGPGINGGGGRRKFSAYGDPCTDYLNNPMFDSLHQTRRYWATDKSITLRPFSSSSGKKHSIHKAINVKNACKVL